MTFYLHPYPYRRVSRRWVADNRFNLGVNIREEDETYVLSALVPGLTADDLIIQVLDDVVRIEGEYKAEEAQYLVRELPGGSFTRTLRMPAPIDAERVDARITDGVLTLKLPKAESARPKKISIKSR
ncbi:MAG: Hsp20/alpha crystallin family protein [Chloroflexi bacterium]|nr:Hsp20/alpha crystallin family protein [Chloroflexota bacterium]